MSDSTAAAEHLKVIRGMMERATVYRALSAPAAIFGGLLALCTGGYFLWRARTEDGLISGSQFFWTWVAALVVVSVFNAVLLMRSAKKEQEAFFSPGMRHAFLAIMPAMLVGGLLSYDQVGLDVELCAFIWVLCYAVALLAMGNVAPRSMRRLGWMFLIVGVLLFALWRQYGAAFEASMGIGDIEVGALLMMATFGVLHVIHGVGVLLRGTKKSTSQAD